MNHLFLSLLWASLCRGGVTSVELASTEGQENESLKSTLVHPMMQGMKEPKQDSNGISKPRNQGSNS